MKRDNLLFWICMAFILLFLYTAFSKWFLFNITLEDLNRSPFLGPVAWPVIILVPATEIFVSVMLYTEKYRRLGLFGAAGLMTMFTLYVAYVLSMTSDRPCTCGGIIRELTWKQHMVFNLCFTALAYFALIRNLRRNRRQMGQSPNELHYQFK